MAFRLTYTSQQNQAQNYTPTPWVIDHFSRGAVSRYLEYIGKPLRQALSDEFGRTVDSFFATASKSVRHRTRYFGATTRSRVSGRRYLPAIWCSVGAETPYLRHDINEYLHP